VGGEASGTPVKPGLSVAMPENRAYNAFEKGSTMKIHRSPLDTAQSFAARHLLLLLALGLTIGGLIPLALAGDGQASKTSASGNRVYTNADLSKYASEDDHNRVTNKQLKEPLPSQSAPIAASHEDWSFVLAMLDREHESAARSKEAADAAAAAYMADHQPQPEGIYGYAPYGYGYGYGYYNGNCVNGNCNDCGSGGPFTHRSNCTPQTTNTMRPLDERGIRTPNQLWRETQRNTAIQRGQITPPSQGVVMVNRATPTHHRH